MLATEDRGIEREEGFVNACGEGVLAEQGLEDNYASGPYI